MSQQVKRKIVTISRILNSDGSLESNSFSDYNHSQGLNNQTDLIDEPDVYGCLLNITEPIIQDAVQCLEGELCVSLDIENTDIAVDINGDLLILHDNSSNYEINENGELEYTFN